MINSNILQINFHIEILYKYLAIIFGGGWDGQMITLDHRGKEGVCKGSKYDRGIFEQPLRHVGHKKIDSVLFCTDCHNWAIF